MPRRLHVPTLRTGFLPLPPVQLHHIRTVLRLPAGAAVDLFDDAGQTGIGELQADGVLVISFEFTAAPKRSLTIAAAVPKGDRADWMIEKLSELGVDVFVPLAAERSVVLPQGKSKHERWQRIAIESAKQSRRVGVMKIEALTKPLAATLPSCCAAYLSTSTHTVPLNQFLELIENNHPLLLYIGPEGGWTDGECGAFEVAGIASLKLTTTILRIETAAIAAAAITLSR